MGFGIFRDFLGISRKKIRHFVVHYKKGIVLLIQQQQQILFTQYFGQK